MQVAENQDGEVKRGTPREYALPHGMEEVVGSIPTRSTKFLHEHTAKWCR